MTDARPLDTFLAATTRAARVALLRCVAGFLLHDRCSRRAAALRHETGTSVGPCALSAAGGVALRSPVPHARERASRAGRGLRAVLSIELSPAGMVASASTRHAIHRVGRPDRSLPVLIGTWSAPRHSLRDIGDVGTRCGCAGAIACSKEKSGALRASSGRRELVRPAVPLRQEVERGELQEVVATPSGQGTPRASPRDDIKPTGRRAPSVPVDRSVVPLDRALREQGNPRSVLTT